jgi:hypothetical protein
MWLKIGLNIGNQTEIGWKIGASDKSADMPNLIGVVVVSRGEQTDARMA